MGRVREKRFTLRTRRPFRLFRLLTRRAARRWSKPA